MIHAGFSIETNVHWEHAIRELELVNTSLRSECECCKREIQNLQVIRHIGIFQTGIKLQKENNVCTILVRSEQLAGLNVKVETMFIILPTLFQKAIESRKHDNHRTTRLPPSGQ
jgi:hypothetical protein